MSRTHRPGGQRLPAGLEAEEDAVRRREPDLRAQRLFGDVLGEPVEEALGRLVSGIGEAAGIRDLDFEYLACKPAVASLAEVVEHATDPDHGLADAAGVWDDSRTPPHAPIGDP